ncbi:MAG TPA: DNA methyltransferase [Polaromonas sp.]|uniref:DNA adenine methylase n=1 Tax=Polaromonas sp. UBA4122 TaxID=1947074 RepID=UPI000ED833D7|nr:DNA adenine methylase [Polaromonas sp. UBA4122]HAL37817.1 DNA methyltransferase [Polaromonas sp.]
MPVTDTPLRYPGGKSQLIPFVIELLRDNDLFYGEYAEPFAGGAGIAMKLLLNDYVSRVYLNDFDPAIHALWHSILHQTDELCDRIERVKVNMEEWHRQRQLYLATSGIEMLDKGFATLFLNRTNRSGIIKAGVIGGLGQTGNYKIDCRFIKPDLVRKIRRIAAYRDQIVLTKLDAAEFLRTVIPTTGKHTLVNLDPPYYRKGPELYTNFYQKHDHVLLSQAVEKISRRWMVTYDDMPEIRALYAQHPMYSTNLNYSAQVKRIGTELLVLDPKLKAPASIHSLRLFDLELETNC